MSPSDTPPSGAPLPPEIIVVREERQPLRWLVWAALTLLAAVIASLGDRLVGRMLAAFEERPPVRTLPPPPPRVLNTPQTAAVPPVAASPPDVAHTAVTAADRDALAHRRELEARGEVSRPERDLVVLAPEPAGPEGEAGLAAAMRAGTLRPAGPSDIAQWVSRHRAQGGRVRDDAIDTWMSPAYVIVRDFTFPGGLHGAHSATFVLPPGVPYPSGTAGHSLLLDVGSGACVGVTCRSLRE